MRVCRFLQRVPTEVGPQSVAEDKDRQLVDDSGQLQDLLGREDELSTSTQATAVSLSAFCTCSKIIGGRKGIGFPLQADSAE